MSDFTLHTYNTSAQDFAAHFSNTGVRTDDIKKAFSLIATPSDKRRVIELGCGDGRDATVIAPAVASYQGFDYAEGLLDIALKRNILNAVFQLRDIRDFDFSQTSSVDIIFAFASLLHLEKEQIRHLLKKSTQILSQGGLWYISLKYQDSYRSEIQEDQYGKRLFYFYHPDEIVALAKPYFSKVHMDFRTIGSTRWFTLALRKT